MIDAPSYSSLKYPRKSVDPEDAATLAACHLGNLGRLTFPALDRGLVGTDTSGRDTAISLAVVGQPNSRRPSVRII
jgi:hypothetical protein